MLPKVKPDIFNKYVDEIKKLGDDIKYATIWILLTKPTIDRLEQRRGHILVP